MRSIDARATAEASDAVVSRGDLLAAATKIRRGATSFASRARYERTGVLTLNQTAVLGLLVKHGALTPTEIAQRLHSTLQSLTRTINSLQSERMIARAVDPSDGRQSILSITTNGREAIWKEMRPRDEWIAGVLESELTPAELEILVAASALLDRLADVDASPARREP